MSHKFSRRSFLRTGLYGDVPSDRLTARWLELESLQQTLSSS